MAKVRDFKLSWKPSISDLVVGYKLYWSIDEKVSYDSKYIALGNVNEAYRTDLINKIPNSSKPVVFGLTAVDDNGNESDMVMLSEPYQLSVPQPPKDFTLSSSDNFEVIEPIQEEKSTTEAPLETESIKDNPVAPAKDEMRLDVTEQKAARIKYYDDVGFRKGAIEKQP